MNPGTLLPRAGRPFSLGFGRRPFLQLELNDGLIACFYFSSAWPLSSPAWLLVGAPHTYPHVACRMLRWEAKIKCQGDRCFVKRAMICSTNWRKPPKQHPLAQPGGEEVNNI